MYVMASLVGGLFAMAVYCLLRRNLLKLVFGFLILSHAVNLLIFTAGGLTRNAPPIAPSEAKFLAAPYADPLPQALILTAIVINFGIFAFLLALVDKARRKTGTDDSDAMKGSDI
jgi:multicomponent Na+:H+ antiporter subunit C